MDAAALRAADDRARLEAQRCFDRPFVLEAGAGTGKTTVLVARVVAWCLGPGWDKHRERLRGEGADPAADRIAAEVLRRVVAITFTEAAAAEMASRVAQVLLVLRDGGLPLGSREEALPPATERPARARALLGCLDQLAVRTIHAWCRRLLAAQPLEVGLHPRFQVDADGRRAREIVREVLERRLAEAYSGRPDRDHLRLAEREIGPAQLEEALLELLDSGVPARALEPDPFTAEALAALHAEVRLAIAAVRAVGVDAFAELRGAKTASATARALAALHESWGTAPPRDAASLAERISMLNETWGKDEQARLRNWARRDLGVKERKAIAGAEDDLAPAARALHALLDHARRIDPERLDCARRVLQPLLDEVEVGLRRTGVQSFEGLLRDTRRLLEQEPAARRVRAEIDQLLVDEFQDTDRTQCAMLAALALPDADGVEPPGLFLVGDPKQSIYGWRNADLAAYEDFIDRVADRGGQLERLSVNYRSVPAILAEVERVIRPVMQAVPRVQPAYQPLAPYRDGEAGYVAGGRAAVEHWVSWGREGADPVCRTPVQDAAELEAAAIAREIAMLHAEGVRWRDVALLFRGLSDLEIYLDALRAAGVPYVVERDQRFYERREIVEARALVRCVLDPRDQLALVTWLRSACVGVPDAALAPLWAEQLPDRAASLRGDRPERLEAALAAVSAAAGRVPALPVLARVAGWEASLRLALTALDHLRAAHEADPPDVFVEKLRGLLAPELSEAARYLGRYRAANLDRFFRDLTSALEESGGDVGAVLAELRTLTDAREAEEGPPRDAADDAVHVLSIHKAKGLDFDHVFLVQLHKLEPNGRPQIRAAGSARGFEYVLFDVPTPAFHASARDLARVNEAERIRTLYVAMTRARERLVLCGMRSETPERTRAEEARCHADLLDARDPAAPDLREAFARALAAGIAHVEEPGVRFLFPVLRAGPLEVLAPPPASPSEDEAALEREAQALARARAAARAHEQRPLGAAASAEKPLLVGEERVESEVEEPGAGPTPPPRAQALVVGTAVHAALEELEPDADPGAARAACGARVAAQLALELGAEEAAQVEAYVAALLDGFFAGPLAERFARLGSGLLARELPVFLPPEIEADGPVGFTAGAIDFLYRDPDSGELVVADWKTDAISAGEVAQRAAGYSGQGRCYVRAVQQALGLERPPRFELWFLHPGVVHALEVG